MLIYMLVTFKLGTVEIFSLPTLLKFDMLHHIITSRGEDRSRPQGPLYPSNNTKTVDYTTLRIAAS